MLFVSRESTALRALPCDPREQHVPPPVAGLVDTSRVYDIHGRGDQCTSADAAGYPMACRLFTAENQAGSINHMPFVSRCRTTCSRTKVYMPPRRDGT
jgi:serine/threonine-protein kinase